METNGIIIYYNGINMGFSGDYHGIKHFIVG